MAESLPAIPIFDPSPELGDVATRWRKWVNRFTNLMTALDIGEDIRLKALLLHYVGETTHNRFDTLAIVGSEDESEFTKAVNALTDHFAPQLNVEFEIFRFRQTRQHEGEDIISFVTRLRQLAATCSFLENDKEIKSQVVQGCSSGHLHRKILTSPKMTLAQVIELARINELAETHAATIESGINITNKMQHIKKQSRNPPAKNTQPAQTCRNCGHSWPHPGGKENCPAFNKTCRICQRRNHFASVCKSTNNRRSNAINNIIHTDDGDMESEDMEAEHVYVLGPGVKQSQPRFAVRIHG